MFPCPSSYVHRHVVAFIVVIVVFELENAYTVILYQLAKSSDSRELLFAVSFVRQAFSL